MFISNSLSDGWLFLLSWSSDFVFARDTYPKCWCLCDTRRKLTLSTSNQIKLSVNQSDRTLKHENPAVKIETVTDSQCHPIAWSKTHCFPFKKKKRLFSSWRERKTVNQSEKRFRKVLPFILSLTRCFTGFYPLLCPSFSVVSVTFCLVWPFVLTMVCCSHRTSRFSLLSKFFRPGRIFILSAFEATELDFKASKEIK